MLLTEVISDIPGVESAQVSLSKAQAMVKYDSAKTNEQAMKQAIAAEGYGV